jgi:glycosyltransferase involved in cell wall biosynthesis
MSAIPSNDVFASSVPGTRPYLSLVIPCYNEEENVPTLLSRIDAAMQPLGRPFEALIIDDGSTDRTPQLLADGQKQYPWLRVMRMKRNASQSAGFEAGFAAAAGDVIATIDADLQNDPEEIPRLVHLLDEHKVDMITGWRKDRQDTAFRKWQSRRANAIRNWITQETVNDSASSLKVYRAHCVKGLKLFKGAHRYFPTLVKCRGYTVLEVPVKHSPRFAGTAKYGFGNRAFVGIYDLIGVRWLKKRWLRYECEEKPRPEYAAGTASPKVEVTTYVSTEPAATANVG